MPIGKSLLATVLIILLISLNSGLNFGQEILIKLLRNLSINYSDFYSDNHLIASSYTGLFTNSGLSKENPFYEYDNINNIDFSNFLIQFIKPDLTPNDRYIIPYNNYYCRTLFNCFHCNSNCLHYY